MELLAGPRGRRLCFEVAMEMDGADETVWPAMFELSYKFEPGATLIVGDDSPPASLPTISHLVSGLNALEIQSLGRQALYAAFQRSVDAARLYQYPDGIDKVLELDVLREPLSRFADFLVAHEETCWWTSPMGGDQWEAYYHPEELGDDFQLPSVRDLHEAESAEVGPSGQWWTMPGGGQITSRLLELGAPAHAYLHEDSLGEDLEGYLVEPVGDVLELAIETWVDLCQRFPADCGKGTWDEATGVKGHWVMPNWTEVAKHWAGVHLSPAAYLECAGVPIAVGNKLSVMAGFAVDATYWLVDLERGPRRIWRHLELG